MGLLKQLLVGAHEPKVRCRRVPTAEPQDWDGVRLFLLRLRLLKSPDGPEILPIFWDDNYIPLLPGEKREITARVRKRDLGEAKPALAIDGFNVTPVLIPTG